MQSIEANRAQTIDTHSDVEAMLRIHRADEVFSRSLGRNALQNVADLLADAAGWQSLAACSKTDVEAFFPGSGGDSSKAKRICDRCDVIEECLKFALDNKERYGIWGGLTTSERNKLRRRRGL